MGRTVDDSVNDTDQAHINNAVTWEVDALPATKEYPVPTDLTKYIKSPEVERANQAISKECPYGSDPALANPDHAVIQQHVDFFDRDQDGVIWPWDTFIGFKRLGYNLLISALAVPFIHGSFSYPTQPSWWPDPFFRIYLRRFNKCKHGSDSMVYDKEGRFDVQKFEGLFTKYDKRPSANKGGLSWDDIQDLIWHHQDIFDPTGWIAERLEWWVLYLGCADENGIVSKEKIRAMYDGSLFYKMAEQYENRNRLGYETRYAAKAKAI